MADSGDKLMRVSLTLDANSGVIAAEPLDQTLQDLNAMGIDPEVLRRTVSATVRRWLNDVKDKSRVQTTDDARPPMPYELVGRAIVEPWMPSLVHMAFRTPARAKVRQVIARLDELELLDVEPYVRIDINQASTGCKLVFALEPRASGKELGRLLHPKHWEVKVCLLRAGDKRGVVVTLGTQLIETVLMPDYAPDEESEWEIEACIRLGVPPVRP